MAEPFNGAADRFNRTGKTVSRARNPSNRGVSLLKVPRRGLIRTARFPDIIPDPVDRTATPVACPAVASAKAGAVGKMRVNGVNR
jgi:hypothetical protein